MLLPLAYGMEQEDASGDVNNYISRGLVFGSSFLFFLFSTGPKIGFETLLQGMAANVEGSGAIFGFVGTFVTIIGMVHVCCLHVLSNELFHYFLKLHVGVWLYIHEYMF